MVEGSDAMVGRVGTSTGARPVPVLQPDAGGEAIVMGASEQDLAGSFIAYRSDIEVAEATRQHAITAALADHRRVLEDSDIEAVHRRDVAAAQCRYSQRNSPRAGRGASQSLSAPRSHAITRRKVP